MQGHVVALGPEGCDASLARAARVHSIDNCVVLGRQCRWSAVSARAAGVLGSTCRPSSWRPGQAVVVARAGGVRTLDCGGLCRRLCSSRGRLQTHVVVGAGHGARAGANYEVIGSYRSALL